MILIHQTLKVNHRVINIFSTVGLSPPGKADYSPNSFSSRSLFSAVLSGCSSGVAYLRRQPVFTTASPAFRCGYFSAGSSIISEPSSGTRVIIPSSMRSTTHTFFILISCFSRHFVPKGTKWGVKQVYFRYGFPNVSR